MQGLFQPIQMGWLAYLQPICYFISVLPMVLDSHDISPGHFSAVRHSPFWDFWDDFIRTAKKKKVWPETKLWNHNHIHQKQNGRCALDGGSLSESRHNWDPKSLKRGFKLLLITNNDSKVQAKHSLWVIIMVVPCVVIADCKTSSCLHLWKQAGWFIKRGGQKKGQCVIQLVDSDTVTIISNA